MEAERKIVGVRVFFDPDSNSAQAWTFDENKRGITALHRGIPPTRKANRGDLRATIDRAIEVSRENGVPLTKVNLSLIQEGRRVREIQSNPT